MKKVLLTTASILLTTAAFAQQPPQADAAFMQHAIGALQAQRNTALDAQAASEAKLAGVTEELNQAKLKIKGLEDKLNPPEKAEDKK